MRIVRHAGLAAAVALATTGAGFALDAASSDADALGPGLVTVEMRIDQSRFSIEHLEVRPGTVVRFEVRNDDPIDHELVIGNAGVHARHRDGTERRHPPVPGEVSVAPGTTGATFYEFDQPGTVVFACHLPGHVAYGMEGEVEVVR